MRYRVGRKTSNVSREVSRESTSESDTIDILLHKYNDKRLIDLSMNGRVADDIFRYDLTSLVRLAIQLVREFILDYRATFPFPISLPLLGANKVAATENRGDLMILRRIYVRVST